jgi:hypothetical protein
LSHKSRADATRAQQRRRDQQAARRNRRFVYAASQQNDACHPAGESRAGEKSQPPNFAIRRFTAELHSHRFFGVPALLLQVVALQFQTRMVAIEGLFQGSNDHIRKPGFNLVRKTSGRRLAGLWCGVNGFRPFGLEHGYDGIEDFEEIGQLHNSILSGGLDLASDNQDKVCGISAGTSDPTFAGWANPKAYFATKSSYGLALFLTTYRGLPIVEHPGALGMRPVNWRVSLTS